MNEDRTVEKEQLSREALFLPAQTHTEVWLLMDLRSLLSQLVSDTIQRRHSRSSASHLGWAKTQMHGLVMLSLSGCRLYGEMPSLSSPLGFSLLIEGQDIVHTADSKKFEKTPV